MRIHAWALAAASGLLATGATAPAALAANTSAIASGTVLGADGSVKGRVRLNAHRNGVQVKLDVRGLPPGVHGVHLHQAGSCNAPDFTSAGPHLNPTGRMHGTHNPQGSHLGDLPNLNVGRSGRGTLTAMLPGASADLALQLFDGDGTALVVHAAADDYATDPSGNSGARIACAVLTRIR
jgi:Cu-Zn family superoxide dismutase